MPLNKLFEKIKSNDFTIGIIGLGRVGLPLATVFANKKIRVIGFDKKNEIISKINSATPPFKEDSLETYLKNAINKKYFRATDDPSEIKKCNVLIITVGTPLKDLRPDYSQIRSVLKSLKKINMKGKHIILRSTSSPLTLEEIIMPYLEEKTGLKAGTDFGLAVCPERIVEGKAIEEIKFLPEIVGGINEISAKITAEVFKKINPRKRITFLTPRGASLAKLFTNVYRYVNFALANEFGLISEKYKEDAHDIIRAVNLDYSRADIPRPGLTGGPCLSKDGYYLTSGFSFPDFIMFAWNMNESIPSRLVGKLKKALESHKKKNMPKSKIGVLGLSFKANSDDIRESPSLRLIESLRTAGAKPLVHDPHVDVGDARKYGIELSSLDDLINDSDAIILATNHSEFEGLEEIIDEKNPDCILVDCWGMFDPKKLKHISKYIGFGRGNYEIKG